MCSKTVVVLLVVTGVAFSECKPQLNPPATEVVKDRLLKSQSFSNLIQMIWQQVFDEYTRPQQEVAPPALPPVSPVPPQSGGGWAKGLTHGTRQVNVEKVKTALLSSNSFNSLIEQIWNQISSQYVTPKPGLTPQPGSTLPPANLDSTIDVEAVKASLFGSETFNTLIQQIWEQISSQYINSGQASINWTGSGGPNNNQNTPNLGPTTVDQAALNARYSFGTEIVDNINGGYQMRDEKRENGKVTGSYAYDDGFVYRTVSYQADGNGFKVLSDTSVPSVMAKQDRSGIAEVKTHRDGGSWHYIIEGQASDHLGYDKLQHKK